MEKIAEIEYKITPEWVMKSYYTHYKVKYEEYSREFYDSLPESAKEVRVEFYEDRFVTENLVKNEKNTYLYDELSAVKKLENAYSFYTNKVEYRFFEFSDFKAEELKKLDDILKKYYEKTEEHIIAEIENFEWTEEKLRKGMFFSEGMKIRIFIMGIALLLLIFESIAYPEIRTLMIALAGIIIIFLWSFYYFKVVPEKTLKSMNPKSIKMKILFYEDHTVLIKKSDPGIIEMKYSEFYKIKKIKSGYSIYPQRNQFYLFEFSEITGNIEELKNILQKYHRRGKKW